MKAFAKITATLALLCAMVFPAAPTKASADTLPQPTDATEYTKATDVEYQKTNGYIHNWGARDEACTFLSTPALAFYENNSYETLSKKQGGTAQNNAQKSELYAALRNVMKSAHTHETRYDETRNLYRYTDCVRNDTAYISSFYSSTMFGSTWDSGATWNREHTWPNSKGMDDRDEDDIMMLRPTLKTENGSRSNKAYGKSVHYHDPGKSVHGDCARIVLYVYVRWGNTNKMWGSEGVIENMNVLLEWMQEDPVDTWEMARNDSVQSITGTRNIFVDYPEYAWLLFGKEIPEGISTPSGIAKEDNSEDSSAPEQERPEDSSSGGCIHAYGEWFIITTPTDTAAGERQRFCTLCGNAQTDYFTQADLDSEAQENENSSTPSESASTLSCMGSIGGFGGAIALPLACAFVLKRRQK